MIELPCPEPDWPRFSALLDAAMDLPANSRAEWLSKLAGDDERLRPRLERLFSGPANPDTENILCPRALDVGGCSAGDLVGPYRLESRLGEGGMGEVWRASRGDDGPRREVALKLPHPALLGGPFRLRFARERDVLAALSHPHIAQLYDAGIGNDGQPYLALELVRGQPITDSLRAQAADLATRIDLVRQVLAGLSYAHQRLIVHRDIKPANVLVTPQGEVKLLDFGIAKLLGADGEADPVLTGMIRLATPAYAAPEQLRGDAITVAADIFAVGVLLFELCTGRRPFVRVPAEPDAAEALPASRCADAALAGIGDQRGLVRRLRGDLDAIIAKALTLDAAGRYASAEAFDGDLRRWRDGLPVRARRVGWPEVARKFVYRNKLGVALAGLLLLSLASGTAGIAWQAHRAGQQAQRAEQAAGRANAIKDFLIDLLQAGDTNAGGERSDKMTVRALLDIAVARSDKAFIHDPTTEVALLGSLANILSTLDEDVRAEQLEERSFTIARDNFGAADPRSLQSAFALVADAMYLRHFDKANAVLETVKPPILSAYGRSSIFYAQWLNAHATSLEAVHGARAEEIAELQASVAIFSHSPYGAAAAENYLNALTLLADRQAEAERFSECLATFEQAKAVASAAGQVFGRLQYQYGQAQCLEKMGDFAAAANAFQMVQADGERLAGQQSVWTRSALVRRARMASLQGDRGGAAALFEQLGASLASPPGSARNNFIASAVREGRGAEVLGALEETVAATRKNAPREDLLRYLEGLLGEAYDQAGDADRARAMLLDARDRWVQDGVPGTSDPLEAEERWGRFLLEHGEAGAAAAQFREVIAQAGGKPLAAASLATAGMARISLANGNLGQAAVESGRAVDMLDAVKMEYDVRNRIEVWTARAEVLLEIGQAVAARTWAEKAAAAADAYCVAGSRYPRSTGALLARMAP